MLAKTTNAGSARVKDIPLFKSSLQFLGKEKNKVKDSMLGVAESMMVGLVEL